MIDLYHIGALVVIVVIADAALILWMHWHD